MIVRLTVCFAQWAKRCEAHGVQQQFTEHDTAEGEHHKERKILSDFPCIPLAMLFVNEQRVCKAVDIHEDIGKDRRQCIFRQRPRRYFDCK